MCEKKYTFIYNDGQLCGAAYSEKDIMDVINRHTPERQAKFEIFELVPVKLETKLSFVRK